MHIKKITVRNFKSFNKKVEIPIFKGFTVISGPNGSGKSNIIDSILFCLGLSHSAKLRADRLPDLIYSGNADEAEVSVVFDNKDGSIPAEPEIVITRKIRLTEKGYYSYYYINGKSSNLSEIHRLLSHAGIHNYAYNVIMQGDVTRITEMTPFQRRRIIDDIAGISEFDEKKERAIEELEIVRENMDRIGTILMEVSSRLEQLARDRDEALKYKSLLERREKNQRYLLAHRYKDLLSKQRRLQNDIEKLEKERDLVAQRFIEIGKIIQDLNSKAEEISAAISAKADDDFQRINIRIIEINSEIEGIKRSEQFYRRELAKLKDDKTRFLLSISKLKDELQTVKEELDRLFVQKISIQEIVNEIESKIELTKIKLKEVDARFQKMRDELLLMKEEMENLKDGKSELVREQDKRLETVRRIGIEVEELEKEREKLKKTISEMEIEIEKKEEEFDLAERELERDIKSRSEVDAKLFTLRNELSEVEEELKSKEVELAKLRAEISTLRFSKSVELVLEAKKKKALPGIYGTVAQLGEVNEKYITALEIAAGNALQFIVVENEDDAIRAINYLKQIRGGRATFLPLNKIKRNSFELKPLPPDEGVIDYAINLVEFDGKFKSVFDFVFRDTVVVDCIQTAKRLMNERRIVTLEGDLIERSGSITGGSVEKSKGILLSKELLEKEKKIMEEVTILNSKKAGIIRDLRSNEQIRKSIQDEIERWNKAVNDMRNAISIANSRIEDARNRISEIEIKLEEKKAERDRIYREMSEIERKIKETEDKIRAKAEKVSEIENILRGSEIPKLASALEGLKDELARNRESLISTEKKIENTEFRKEQIEKAKIEKEKEVQRMNEDEREITLKISRGVERAKELNKELESLKKEEDKIGKEVKKLREERDRILEEIRKMEQEKQNINFRIVTLEEKIKARNEALQAVEAEILEMGEYKIDDLPAFEQITSELEEVEKELAEFGDVNLKAIQEYEEVKNRRDELLERNLTLEKERKEILNRIEKYEKMKRDAFFTAFNAINKNFSEIINKLADGEGELYLDDEDPFNSGMHIRVKFHDKSPQKLDSMSGGEKSLVALALIFAIQQYKPAPFYAFDEVDMFLDGVNVSKVAKMIKERSKNAQFVVVSLRKPMLEIADSIIGVTLGRDNSSKVTGIRLKA